MLRRGAGGSGRRTGSTARGVDGCEDGRDVRSGRHGSIAGRSADRAGPDIDRLPNTKGATGRGRIGGPRIPPQGRQSQRRTDGRPCDRDRRHMVAANQDRPVTCQSITTPYLCAGPVHGPDGVVRLLVSGKTALPEPSHVRLQNDGSGILDPGWIDHCVVPSGASAETDPIALTALSVVGVGFAEALRVCGGGGPSGQGTHPRAWPIRSGRPCPPLRSP